MYNPSEAGKKGTIFGLPYEIDEADLILLPVHLDVTVSYNDGTAKAPDLILDESSQLDLSLLNVHNPWELKMAMSERFVASSKNEIQRGRARNIIKALESGKQPEEDQIQFVNEFCESIHLEIQLLAEKFLGQDKLVAVVGGDHSSPLGLIRALAKKQSFGILQIDAHMDLREDYERFTYSHASIMFNAMKEEGVSSLTQVGIRDFCEEEEHYIENSEKPIHVFYDEAIYSETLETPWSNVVTKIIETLPASIYISFDMDGLDPSLCPHTGTPVPGGLTFNQIIYLLDEIVKSGKRIIGFDVCETGNDAWDANVASRILFRLAACTGITNGLLSHR